MLQHMDDSINDDKRTCFEDREFKISQITDHSIQEIRK